MEQDHSLTYIHTYIHTCIYTFIRHTYTHTYVRTYMHTYSLCYRYTHTHTHTPSVCVYICMHMPRVHICMYVYTQRGYARTNRLVDEHASLYENVLFSVYKYIHMNMRVCVYVTDASVEATAGLCIREPMAASSHRNLAVRLSPPCPGLSCQLSEIAGHHVEVWRSQGIDII